MAAQHSSGSGGGRRRPQSPANLSESGSPRSCRKGARNRTAASQTGEGPRRNRAPIEEPSNIQGEPNVATVRVPPSALPQRRGRVVISPRPSRLKKIGFCVSDTWLLLKEHKKRDPILCAIKLTAELQMRGLVIISIDDAPATPPATRPERVAAVSHALRNVVPMTTREQLLDEGETAPGGARMLSLS